MYISSTKEKLIHELLDAVCYLLMSAESIDTQDSQYIVLGNDFRKVKEVFEKIDDLDFSEIVD